MFLLAFILKISQFKNYIEKNFGEDHFILFGINTIDNSNNKYYNSLVLINNKFEVIQLYKKQKLVPFGEFLPFENFLNNFGLKRLLKAMDLFKRKNTKKYYVRKFEYLPLICYEIIFPELTQKSSLETNLIINIPEDGWFGRRSIGPHQHFAKAIFRSIENNSFLLRSANKGISAIIDNKGQIIKRLSTYEAGSIEMKIPLIKSKYKNKNDLIFFTLLFTYLIIFLIFKNENNAKK